MAQRGSKPFEDDNVQYIVFAKLRFVLLSARPHGILDASSRTLESPSRDDLIDS